MLVFRPTPKLMELLKVDACTPDPFTPDLIGEWYADEFLLDGTSFILSVNSVSLLSVVLPSSPHNSYFGRLPSGIYKVLSSIGLPTDEAILACSGFKKTLIGNPFDKSMLVILSSFRSKLQKADSADVHACEPVKMSQYLNDCSVEFEPYLTPAQNTVVLLREARLNKIFSSNNDR